jgi:hypothetical protein
VGLGSAELSELAQAPALEELDLWDEFANRQVDATLLKSLESLPALRVLALNGWADPAWIAPERTRAFARLRGLEELRMWDFELGNDGLAAVCELRHLTRLHYDGHLTADGLQVLAGVPGLLALELNRAGTTDDGLAHLGVLQSLQWLELSNCPITDGGLRHLEALPAIRALILDGTGISDNGLHTVTLPALRRFSARGTSVTQDGAWNRRAVWAPRLRDACGDHWSVGSQPWARGERSW